MENKPDMTLAEIQQAMASITEAAERLASSEALMPKGRKRAEACLRIYAQLASVFSERLNTCAEVFLLNPPQAKRMAMEEPDLLAFYGSLNFNGLAAWWKSCVRLDLDTPAKLPAHSAVLLAGIYGQTVAPTIIPAPKLSAVKSPSAAKKVKPSKAKPQTASRKKWMFVAAAAFLALLLGVGGSVILNPEEPRDSDPLAPAATTAINQTPTSAPSTYAVPEPRRQTLAALREKLILEKVGLDSQLFPKTFPDWAKQADALIGPPDRIDAISNDRELTQMQDHLQLAEDILKRVRSAKDKLDDALKAQKQLLANLATLKASPNFFASDKEFLQAQSDLMKAEAEIENEQPAAALAILTPAVTQTNTASDLYARFSKTAKPIPATKPAVEPEIVEKKLFPALAYDPGLFEYRLYSGPIDAPYHANKTVRLKAEPVSAKEWNHIVHKTPFLRPPGNPLSFGVPTNYTNDRILIFRVHIPNAGREALLLYMRNGAFQLYGDARNNWQGRKKRSPGNLPMVSGTFLGKKLPNGAYASEFNTVGVRIFDYIYVIPAANYSNKPGFKDLVFKVVDVTHGKNYLFTHPDGKTPASALQPPKPTPATQHPYIVGTFPFVFRSYPRMTLNMKEVTKAQWDQVAKKVAYLSKYPLCDRLLNAPDISNQIYRVKLPKHAPNTPLFFPNSDRDIRSHPPVMGQFLTKNTPNKGGWVLFRHDGYIYAGFEKTPHRVMDFLLVDEKNKREYQCVLDPFTANPPADVITQSIAPTIIFARESWQIYALPDEYEENLSQPLSRPGCTIQKLELLDKNGKVLKSSPVPFTWTAPEGFGLSVMNSTQAGKQTGMVNLLLAGQEKNANIAMKLLAKKDDREMIKLARFLALLPTLTLKSTQVQADGQTVVYRDAFRYEGPTPFKTLPLESSKKKSLIFGKALLPIDLLTDAKVFFRLRKGFASYTHSRKAINRFRYYNHLLGFNYSIDTLGDLTIYSDEPSVNYEEHHHLNVLSYPNSFYTVVGMAEVKKEGNAVHFDMALQPHTLRNLPKLNFFSKKGMRSSLVSYMKQSAEDYAKIRRQMLPEEKIVQKAITKAQGELNLKIRRDRIEEQQAVALANKQTDPAERKRLLRLANQKTLTVKRDEILINLLEQKQEALTASMTGQAGPGSSLWFGNSLLATLSGQHELHLPVYGLAPPKLTELDPKTWREYRAVHPAYMEIIVIKNGQTILRLIPVLESKGKAAPTPRSLRP